ncbi:hypothetical protein H9P43_003254 [Blastocladiella emersonii ATCC 22665]|nr:hypothetical protein H9P43_003254 [Blastocladiella emersonii ATCC 22665]
MSILSHDMQPRDPYDGPSAASHGGGGARRRVNESLENDPFKFRYKPALTKSSADVSVLPAAGLPTFRQGQLAGQNFDGTARTAPPSASAQPRSVTAGRRYEPAGSETFFLGNVNNIERPRPLGAFGSMSDTRPRDPRMREEMVQYERVQREELERRRLAERQDAAAMQYFPFGQDHRSRQGGRIVHATDDRSGGGANMDGAEPRRQSKSKEDLAAGIRAQLQERESLRQAARAEAQRPVDGFFPTSHRPNARIQHFTDAQWDGPPPDLKFGTSGGGAPVSDPAGSIKTALPLSLEPRLPHAHEDPAAAGRQMRYRAALDQQRQMSASLAANRTVAAQHPAASLPLGEHYVMDADARFPLRHSDAVNPYTEGSITSQRVPRARRPSAVFVGPAATGGEHGRELARNPHHYSTDVTRLQDVYIRETQQHPPPPPKPQQQQQQQQARQGAAAAARPGPAP